MPPQGFDMATSASLPFLDQRSTRPWFVAQTVSPSIARKSAKPGTVMTCSLCAPAADAIEAEPAANAMAIPLSFFMISPFVSGGCRAKGQMEATIKRLQEEL